MNVFTYGTLMFDEVWRPVVGRLGPSIAGTLDDFQTLKIAGEVFPGMIPATSFQVTGRVWQGVLPNELAQLDRYESGIYERKAVAVRTAAEPLVDCWAYVVRSEFRALLLAESWDPENFRKRHLPTYLRAWTGKPGIESNRP